jgi:hypothetical protein
VRHDGKAENVYETKEAAFEPRLLRLLSRCGRDTSAFLLRDAVWPAGLSTRVE